MAEVRSTRIASCWSFRGGVLRSELGMLAVTALGYKAASRFSCTRSDAVEKKLVASSP